MILLVEGVIVMMRLMTLLRVKFVMVMLLEKVVFVMVMYVVMLMVNNYITCCILSPWY